MNSIYGVGGEIPLSPKVLEKKLIKAYLDAFGAFYYTAIKLCKAADEPITLECVSDHKPIKFDYIFGLVHTVGIEYSDKGDIATLQQLASRIPQLKKAKIAIAPFLPFP